MRYKNYIKQKEQKSIYNGFDPVFVPDYLFDFQKSLVEWAVKKGRCALFADCGLGKTILQLVWAENIIRKHGGKIIIFTPLAVGIQTQREAERFGIEAKRVKDGEVADRISITNYEQMHKYNSNDFIGCVCDESSILKNFKGVHKQEITKFMRKMSFRLLCTATAAPNDYIELGTSSEALGELGFMDMLGRFFKNDTNPTVDTKRRYAAHGGDVPKWRFKFHAEIMFWQWVSSWSRAIRRPSDIGFDDNEFKLPDLIETEHIIDISRPMEGFLLPIPATCLKDQRQERRFTIVERCEMAAEISNKNETSILWCYLNDEGDMLEKLTDDCVQVAGRQSDEEKEEKLMAFISGDVKRLITKPMCAGFGLNLQHCSHMTVFPSHSYEQYYQSVRRCWRFGQKKNVAVDIISTKGEEKVLINLRKKSKACDDMFSKLVSCMNDSMSIKPKNVYTKKERVPAWL